MSSQTMDHVIVEGKPPGMRLDDLTLPDLPYYRQFMGREEIDRMRFDNDALRMLVPQESGLAIAKTIPGYPVLDLFCGGGGMAVALARSDKQVIAVDRDRHKLALAAYNAEALGVRDRLLLVHADSTRLHGSFGCSAIFLDPPWGGSARRLSEFTLDHFAVDLRRIFTAVAGDACHVTLKLPFNFRQSDLQLLAPEWSVTPVYSPAIGTERVHFWIAQNRSRN